MSLERRSPSDSTPSTRTAPSGGTASGTLEAETGEGSRIRAAIAQIRNLLVPGERLDAFAVQRRIFALTRRRTILAATTGRFLVFHRGRISGFRLEYIRWQDMQDVRLHVGILGANLIVRSLISGNLAGSGEAAPVLEFRGLRKDQAQRVYTLCQAQEQAWRETRRIRELEEMRARSGGIHLGASAGVSGGGFGEGAEKEDPVLRLQRAKEMLQGGLITDAEYEAITARVVSGL